MRRLKLGQIFLIIFALTLASCLIFPTAVSGGEEEEKDERPPRSIAMAPEYPGVIVPPGEEVEMDLILYNKGKSDENVLVDITSIPKGWKARVKTYKFTVTGAHVENGDSTRLTFFAKPEKKEIKPGKYVFKLDKDMVYNLTSKGPENWEINFKPAYEDKYISSLRLEKNGSKSMAVEVKPHRLAEAGEYPINVRVGSADAKAEAKLTVILTGTYKLEAGTPTGLLSLEAQKGKPANMSIYVSYVVSLVML